ncbi:MULTISPECIES: hypothetical protein [Fischerella]|uniref:Uncharacterized protein n=1 Tax=Fischerella muscicola CCMEE 5323 TaxID=2019572 RepID=A0A2N6K7U1_FISMU|nr:MULTISPECIES: hypothetical protein [Fischerella]MBD2432703.1 hypothetical protein [Fischerella sp. FACHB-380]PLZ93409.1 hypothetical protein CEN44_03275 [Fischerella muscicola CCMEE 5323]
MSISNSQQDLVSLIFRISQLEEEHNIRRKNITWLKHYLDELKQEFNARPELEQIEVIQQAIVQLTAQVAELQERFKLLPIFNTNLERNNTTYASNELVNLDNADGIKQQQPQEALVDKFAIPVSISAVESVGQV